MKEMRKYKNREEKNRKLILSFPPLFLSSMSSLLLLLSPPHSHFPPSFSPYASAPSSLQVCISPSPLNKSPPSLSFHLSFPPFSSTSPSFETPPVIQFFLSPTSVPPLFSPHHSSLPSLPPPLGQVCRQASHVFCKRKRDKKGETKGKESR